MIKRLLQLNGLAAMAAILYHAAGWGFVAMFWWANQYRPVTVPNFDQLGTPTYYSLRMIEQIITSGVPIFLFVSGFFVAIATGHHNTTIGWRLVSKRIGSLLIPYFVWSLAIFSADFLLLGIQYAPFRYLKLLAVGGATSAYYYVPLVCQLYLLAPFLVPLAKRRWRLLLIVSLLVQVYVQLSRYEQILNRSLLPVDWFVRIPSWAFPGFLFWFSFGIIVGFHLVPFKQWLAKIKWALLPLALMLVPLGMLEWEFLLGQSGQEWLTRTRIFSDELLSIVSILAFLAYADFALPFSNRLSELGKRSYGVYLVHTMVLLWASKLIYQLEPWILGYQVLYQPILIALGLGVPLLLMALVNRSPARRYYQYIFG
ncbi:MAG: acyltransferase [Caldilineaceae bacterium]|nr:acyltransferase [Caldilineaceae bacterium]